MSARIAMVCAAYAVLAVALELAGVPHGRLVMLVAQYAALLPFLVVTLRRAGGDDAQLPTLDRRVAIAIGAACALAIVAIAIYWNRGMLWGDETAYRIQAQMFATGHPWADAPPPTSPDAALSAHELRFNHHIIHDGHWFTKYPPAWPAVLALGDLVHLRWLVNPLLAVLALAIIYRIGKRELSLPAPGLAIAMLATSPFFFMMAASQMSHLLGLVCCAGAALGVLHAARTGELRPIAGSLALLALCAFVRPFTAFCAALALLPFTFPIIGKSRRAWWLVPIGAGLGLATLAAMALYNHLYTGDYARSPYALYRGTELPVELSLAPDVIFRNLRDAVRWSLQDTLAFTFPLMFALAIYALRTDRQRRYEHALVLAMFGVFALANLFHTEGSSSRFGDRYLFEAIFGPALVAVRGAALVVERWRVPARLARTCMYSLTLAGAAQAAVLVRPTLREIHPYRVVRDAVDALPADGSLVYFPVTDDFTGDRFDLNAADWREAPHMFLVDPGASRRAAVAAAEGRTRWIVLSYDGGTDRAVVVASGP